MRKVGSSTQGLSEGFDRGEKMAISKMEVFKKRKSRPSCNSCVYTYKAKWKTEAITQMISIKTSRNTQKTEAIIRGDSCLLGSDDPIIPHLSTILTCA